ncbi:UNVERIFIED_CONTAM: hypothetical protein HDU68_007813 [Siphonaria sp. JEL0065]|nr:hypothetical protein HDU68_007813 [Siphonaria sp. JEL0065]
MIREEKKGIERMVLEQREGLGVFREEVANVLMDVLKAANGINSMSQSAVSSMIHLNQTTVSTIHAIHARLSHFVAMSQESILSSALETLGTMEMHATESIQRMLVFWEQGERMSREIMNRMVANMETSSRGVDGLVDNIKALDTKTEQLNDKLIAFENQMEESMATVSLNIETILKASLEIVQQYDKLVELS